MGEHIQQQCIARDFNEITLLSKLKIGEIFKILHIILVEKECFCQEVNGVCQFPTRHLFPNGKIFIIGQKLNVKPLSSSSIVRESCFNRTNDILGFIKKIDSASLRLTIRAFFPTEIEYKGILINSEKGKNEFCVINKIRFEMD